LTRLVVASHNRMKAGEMVEILHARFPGLEILTLADFDGAPEPNETGTTYADNAVIKARSAAAFTGEWCLADDAGLEIDALDGAPGLYSRRFGGEHLPFPEKMAMILDLLRETPFAQRGARFRCCVALMPPGESAPEVYADTCEGQIAETPSGAGGFGYDPIFWLPELGCCMADLTPDQKHAISHRGKVLRRVGDRIAELTASAP